MKINTKFNIGDWVKNKNQKIAWQINGIVIYKNNEIGYFHEYEEDTEMEENLELNKKGENHGTKNLCK